jgi:polysaccharide deacetylase 2 family uncharacterized protein YibQ
MGLTKKNNNGTPWPVIIIWVLVAIVCLQGYFLFTHKTPQVPVKPVAVKPAVKPVVKPSAGKVTGRIAIVLDDWGFNRTHCKYLGGFGAPVAAAILPNLEYSKDVLQCARSSGQEAMLHLPLEPHVNRDVYPRGYILTTWMSQKEVSKLLKRILDEYPGIVGVNNHMGSKATEDKALMTTILTELKRRGLFFVDSMTSGQTVCSQVAGDMGIPFAKRAVFLDNRNERVAIERSFAEGARIAKERGFALLIGHDRELTLKIVTEQIRKLKQQGYQFLSVKDFIRAQKE